MKKARIVLAAIAVVGIVGGSLAFKNAQKTNVLFYTAASPDVSVTSGNLYGDAKTTAVSTGAIYEYYTTTVTGTTSSNKFYLLLAD